MNINTQHSQFCLFSWASVFQPLPSNVDVSSPVIKKLFPCLTCHSASQPGGVNSVLFQLIIAFILYLMGHGKNIMAPIAINHHQKGSSCFSLLYLDSWLCTQVSSLYFPGTNYCLYYQAYHMVLTKCSPDGSKILHIKP